MSYQIIIADDEEKIVQLIQRLGHWEALDIRIVDVCSNGVDAYESIRKHKPDIVLTDIKMPGYDGLKLIEMTKALGYDTNFIVVSGYRHFDYARGAIQLGVVDYLLKPLDEAQLNDTLERTCLRVDASRAQSSQQETLEQYVKDEAQRRRTDLWSALLSAKDGPVPAGFSSQDEMNDTFGTKAVHPYFLAAAIVTNLDVLLNETSSVFGEKVRRSIQTVFGEQYPYLHTARDGTHFLLLNPPEGELTRIRRHLESVFSELRMMQEIYGEFDLYIGFSSVKTSPAQLSAALREAAAACFGRFLSPNQGVFSFSAAAELPRFRPESVFTEGDRTNLKNCLKYYQFEEMGRLFASVAQRARVRNRSNPLDFFSTLERMIDSALPYIAAPEQSSLVCAGFYLDCVSALSFEAVIRRFYLRLETLLRRNYDEVQKKHGKPVEDAKRYIEKNYARQISLEDVATQVGLSSAYFSKLFKSELNTGYAEYLTEVRMEHAKHLLLETTASVKEIAVQVGYLDDKYFSKLFKKQVGIKPSDFRKLYTG